MNHLASARLLGLCIALALLLACDATQHVQRGDAAMRAGQPREALGSYQRAMQSDAKLRGDPAFAANLREASWRTAFLDAEAAATAGTWDRTIGLYSLPKSARRTRIHPHAPCPMHRSPRWRTT